MSELDDKILQLLFRLSNLDFLNEYYLADGTNLALRYNHRTSIDLDFFIFSDFNLEENNFLYQQLLTEFDSLNNSKVSSVGVFTFIDNIKVDFVIYPYKLIGQIDEINNVKLASIIDIAAMKMNAIVGRGSKKDFFDIHFLLGYLNFSEMIEAYKQKYKIDNLTQLVMSLTFFDDAQDNLKRDNIFEPKNHQASWAQIRQDIKAELKKYIEANK